MPSLSLRTKSNKTRIETKRDQTFGHAGHSLRTKSNKTRIETFDITEEQRFEYEALRTKSNKTRIETKKSR